MASNNSSYLSDNRVLVVKNAESKRAMSDDSEAVDVHVHVYWLNRLGPVLRNAAVRKQLLGEATGNVAYTFTANCYGYTSKLTHSCFLIQAFKFLE